MVKLHYLLEELFESGCQQNWRPLKAWQSWQSQCTGPQTGLPLTTLNTVARPIPKVRINCSWRYRRPPLFARFWTRPQNGSLCGGVFYGGSLQMNMFTNESLILTRDICSGLPQDKQTCRQISDFPRQNTRNKNLKFFFSNTIRPVFIFLFKLLWIDLRKKLW